MKKNEIFASVPNLITERRRVAQFRWKEKEGKWSITVLQVNDNRLLLSYTCRNVSPWKYVSSLVNADRWKDLRW